MGFNPDNIRTQVAAISDNITRLNNIKFDTLPVANQKYYLQNLGKWLKDYVITGFAPSPNNDTLYNELSIFDYNKFFVTLVNTDMRIIIDALPLSYFENDFVINKKLRMLYLENVDFQYSYVTWNGETLLTGAPFIIPFAIKYIDPKRKDYDF